jgi:hypothetical protein
MNDTRCLSKCEVIPGAIKRCIRPHEHVEESHVWIESLSRADGPPRMVVWTRKKIIYCDININATIMVD